MLDWFEVDKGFTKLSYAIIRTHRTRQRARARERSHAHAREREREPASERQRDTHMSRPHLLEKLVAELLPIQ